MALLVAFAVFLSAAGDAQAKKKTFSNPATITINDSGPATPYPSVIDIKANGRIGDLNVKLYGFTHTHDADVDVMLVGPEGQCAIVQSEVGAHDLVLRLRQPGR